MPSPPPDAPPIPLVARPRALLGLLLLATALVFLPALGGEFVWDDTLLLGANPYVRDLSRLGEALTHDFWHVPQNLEAHHGAGRRYYRPVVTLAYALQFRVFGEHPVGYHLVNLGLHLGCVVLVLGWLRRRLGVRADLPEGPVALVLGAALFALHPSRPESVAWISGSTDLWLTLLALLALRAYDRRPTLVGAAQAAVLLFFATLCKETAVVVPALLAIDLVLLRPPGTPWRPGVARLALASAGVVLAFGLRFALVPRFADPTPATALPETAARVLTSGAHYLLLIVAPWWPSVQIGLKTFDQGRVVYAPALVTLGALALGALGALALAARTRPALRPWLADVLWCTLGLGPTLNLISMEQHALVAARFLYLPLLGVCALVARVALAPPTPRGHALRAAVGVFVLAAAVVCSQHAARFVDAETLWTAELRRNPDNYYAYNALALHLQERGQYAQTRALLLRGHAAAHTAGATAFETTLALQLAHLLLWTTPDDDHTTLEALRRFLQDFTLVTEGVARLETPGLRLGLALAAQSYPTRQDVRHRQQWAWAMFRSGQEPEAEAMLRNLTDAHPHAYTAWRYLAMVRAARNDLPSARGALQQLLARNPQDGVAALLDARLAQHLRDLAAAPDPIARTSLTARLLVDLSRASRARSLVAPLLRDHPTRVEPLAARLYAELSDRRPDVAEALVQEASARTPERAAAFREAFDGLRGQSPRALPTP